MFLLRSSRRRISSGQLSREEVVLALYCYSQGDRTELPLDYSLLMLVRYSKNKILCITAQFIATSHELPTGKQYKINNMALYPFRRFHLAPAQTTSPQRDHSVKADYPRHYTRHV